MIKPYKLTFPILQSKYTAIPRNVDPISIINPNNTVLTQKPPKTNSIHFTYLTIFYSKVNRYNILKSNLRLNILQSMSQYQE